MNKEQSELLNILGLELEQEFVYRDDVFKFILTDDNTLNIVRYDSDYRCFMETSLRVLLLINNKDKIKLFSKEILTNKERDYLSFVIKPFKNKVKHIVKLSTGIEDYIQIYLINDVFTLPRFKKGTIYKNMEYDKKYYPCELRI